MSAESTLTRWTCSFAPSSTQMPASRKQTAGSRVASRVTRMLPGCRSPCNKLSWKIILQTASTPTLAKALRRASSTSRLRYSRIDGPSTKSSTNTSSLTNARRGAGKLTLLWFRKFSRRRSRLSASARMSICAPSVAANSSAAAARLNHLARGISASPARAQARRKSRSEATRRRAAGCTTLTATRSPRRPPFVTSFLRTAECTWATQPVPTGAASTSRTSRQSGPSDASRARSVSRHACAGARSCKWAKRSQNARGKRSSRDEAHCASLTAVGPAARVAQRQ
mmetsp:Transcript_21676/g.56567  ORF Transcript_21676/g.56567 Transcript_21676/m.56567 type:complete len:283 (+) Transcript_21676:421-1269(+)